MTYITTPGQITQHVYHVDILQLKRQRQTSIFIYWDGTNCLLMDVGTSNDIEQLFKSLDEIGIPHDRVMGIVVTHYHFDHAGGASRLWDKMSKQNPNFKIIVPEDIYQKLQNAETHMIGAKTTYGNNVGEMHGLPKYAFTIVKKESALPIKLADGYQFQLISVPGHTDDHCAPTLFKNRTPVFCFSGESCGALCNASPLISMPTSMPPAFNFEKYMMSCRKIGLLSPEILGFCHFGAISGQDEIAAYLAQHTKEMILFRETVIRAYNEKPDTRYVVGQVLNFFEQKKTISTRDSEPNSPNVIFAITYGMMVDLGFREPKYERR